MAINSLGFSRPAVAGRVVGAVAPRPDLWLTALHEWKVLCPGRWWARWPPLPLPPRGYLAFRFEAMYGADTSRSRVPGGSGGEPSPSEVVAYLEWCRRMRALLR